MHHIRSDTLWWWLKYLFAYKQMLLEQNDVKKTSMQLGVTAKLSYSQEFSSPCFILLTFCFFLLSFATNAEAETIYEALRNAYHNNPRIIAERARQKSDFELEAQARSGFLPNISLDADVTRNQSRLKDPTSNTDLDQKSINITLSQPIYRGFRNFNELSRARSQIRAGKNKLLDTEQSVLLSAATSYINVLKNKRILKLRNENISFLRRELRVIKSRFKEGELTKTDIEQAKARLYQGLESKEIARANLADTVSDYVFNVGNFPKKLRYPKKIAALNSMSLTHAIHIAKNENPRIMKAREEKEVAEYNLKIAYGELFPTIDLEASYEREHQPSASNSRSDTGEVAVRLKLPLYTGGVTRSKIRQARAQKTQAAYSYRDITNQVKRSVKSLWHRRQVNLERISTNKKNVVASQRSVKGLRYELKSGEREIVDLLNAQKELINARINYVSSKYDFLISNFELLAILGRLDIKKLKKMERSLSSDKNYRSRLKQTKWIRNPKLIKPYLRRK